MDINFKTLSLNDGWSHGRVAKSFVVPPWNFKIYYSKTQREKNALSSLIHIVWLS